MSNKSQASLLVNIPVASFIQNVASRSPAPGGGSVAAFSGSLGAALGAMVCRLTIGKKKYKEVEGEMRKIEKQLLDLRDKLKEAVDEDTFAFDDVMAAFDLPKETEEEVKIRNEAINKANKKATEVPFNVMKMTVTTAKLLVSVAEKGNVNSVSDVGVAGLSCETAFEGALLNVRINIKDMEDDDWKSSVLSEIEELKAEFYKYSEGIRKHVNERIG